MKYNKVFVFLFILICFTSIAYSADETFTDVFNDTNDYENIENNENIENTDNNIIYNNINEKSIEEEYEDNSIPDNNFEDGYEHSEIIELNDTTIYPDEDIITNITHPTSRPNRAASNNNMQTPIISTSHSYISAKVVLKKITDTTYNTTFIVTDNCSVYYTLNGNNPTTASTKYSKAFVYNTSKTLKYFAITKDGDKGPVLSMKLSEGSTPYIAYKTPITNKKQTIYLSYTLPQTKIYYTLDGSTPTVQSSEYTKALSINNNTQVKFIAVYATKTTPVYQYKMNAIKPTVTIKNTTDVRNNYQNITIKINKLGKIYYTRNGSKPTTQSNTWTNNTNVMISIKTQVRTILIDDEGFTSDITYYQPPKIITPPITAIRPITTLINNIQKIQFSTNQQNSTIYYTTDKTNPLTSNTTKTAKNNDKINLNKNTRLKYYTKDDIQGYKSAVYNYTPVQNANERPTITIINATNIWNNGQQKIIIQSNQPGKFNIKKYNDTNTEQILNNTGSYTSNIKYKLQIYTQHEDKYSKIIEYNPSTSTKTVMNYSYTILISYSQISSTNEIEFNSNNQSITINVNQVVVYNFQKNKIKLLNSTSLNSFILNNNEMLTYKNSTNLCIRFYKEIYGDVNGISILKQYHTNGELIITSIENGEKKELLNIKLIKNYIVEYINTIFKSNFNKEKIEKQEIIHMNFNNNNNQWDSLQTYILSNKILTKNILKSYINLNKTYTGDFRKAYLGTTLTGLTTINFYDETSKFFSSKLNVSLSRQDDIQILVGVHGLGTTYITTPDPTLGLEINGNENNKKYFRLISTLMLSECERMSIQCSNQTVTSAFEIFFNEIENSDLIIIYDENNNIINISTNEGVYTFEIDLNTGIVKTLIKENSEYLKGAFSLDNQGYCYHDERTSFLMDSINNLYSIVTGINDKVSGIASDISPLITDEVANTLKDWAGSTAITAGVTILVASGGTALPIIAGAIIVGAGVSLCLNAAGATSLNDLGNPYYWVQAAPTIISSAIIPAGEIRMAANGLKLYSKISTPLSHRGTYLLRSSVKTNGLNNWKSAGKSYMDSKGISYLNDWGFTCFNANPTNS